LGMGVGGGGASSGGASSGSGFGAMSGAAAAQSNGFLGAESATRSFYFGSLAPTTFSWFNVSSGGSVSSAATSGVRYTPTAFFNFPSSSSGAASSSPAVVQQGKCPKGHALAWYIVGKSPDRCRRCDRADVGRGGTMYWCRECNWRCCDRCCSSSSDTGRLPVEATTTASGPNRISAPIPSCLQAVCTQPAEAVLKTECWSKAGQRMRLKATFVARLIAVTDEPGRSPCILSCGARRLNAPLAQFFVFSWQGVG
jgi:hypothetical protein